jgi:RNA polymerase sigma-70 factor (ECF subfamily)
LAGFLRAIRQRDTQQLETLMAADIGFYADGGGKVPLAAGTCLGAAPVAALLMRVYHTYLVSAEIVYTVINHQPALLSYVAGRLTSCQVFDLHPSKVPCSKSTWCWTRTNSNPCPNIPSTPP